MTDATRGGFGLNPDRLPEGLESYRRTATMTESTVPVALLFDHDTKAGTWGLIHLAEGQLRYRVTDPRRVPLDTILSPETPAGVIEPTILHNVEPIGRVSFQVEFWR